MENNQIFNNELPSCFNVFLRLSLATLGCALFLIIEGAIGYSIPGSEYLLFFMPPLYTGSYFAKKTGIRLPFFTKLTSLIIWYFAQALVITALLAFAIFSLPEYKGEAVTISDGALVVLVLGLPYIGFTYAFFHIGEIAHIKTVNKT